MPPVITLNHPAAYDIWVVWRALGRRFLPSQILAEPEELLADIITLDSVFDTLEKKMRNDGN